MDSLTLQKTQVQVRVNSFVRSVYNWMAVGLGLTGVVAYSVANMPEIRNVVFGSGIVFFGLIIAQLALVFMLSARIYRMQAGTATLLFVLYSALNGATLSSIFLAYAQSSITSTFFVCSATFVACSIYGWTTRRDLTSFGGFLTMGLIGIVIASLVNLFIQSSAVSTIVSYIGVLVFVGLITARWFGWAAPDLSETEYLKLWDIVQIGLGGYTVGRTVEKIAPSIVVALKK